MLSLNLGFLLGLSILFDSVEALTFSSFCLPTAGTGASISSSPSSTMEADMP